MAEYKTQYGRTMHEPIYGEGVGDFLYDYFSHEENIEYYNEVMTDFFKSEGIDDPKEIANKALFALENLKELVFMSATVEIDKRKFTGQYLEGLSGQPDTSVVAHPTIYRPTREEYDFSNRISSDGESGLLLSDFPGEEELPAPIGKLQSYKASINNERQFLADPSSLLTTLMHESLLHGSGMRHPVGTSFNESQDRYREAAQKLWMRMSQEDRNTLLELSFEGTTEDFMDREVWRGNVRDYTISPYKTMFDWGESDTYIDREYFPTPK